MTQVLWHICSQPRYDIRMPICTYSCSIHPPTSLFRYNFSIYSRLTVSFFFIQNTNEFNVIMSFKRDSAKCHSTNPLHTINTLISHTHTNCVCEIHETMRLLLSRSLHANRHLTLKPGVFDLKWKKIRNKSNAPSLLFFASATFELIILLKVSCNKENALLCGMKSINTTNNDFGWLVGETKTTNSNKVCSAFILLFLNTKQMK